MGDTGTKDVTLDQVPPFELGEWEQEVTTTNEESILTYVSPSRKHQVKITPVALENPDVQSGYLIELYRGEQAYASHRELATDTIVTDPDRVPVVVQEVIAEETDDGL